MPSQTVSTGREIGGIRDEVAALKRERTIEAAVELFYERGYENTTLEAVADRLGVTKPFIYSHFGSKTELLTEICSRGIASALRAIESVSGMRSRPARKLALLGERFVTAVLESQKHIAIFNREEKNLPAEDFTRISNMRREFDAKLAALLQEGVDAGDFKVEDVPLAALAIGGIVSWAYVWYRPDGRLTLPDLSSHMSDLILTMVGAPARHVRHAPAKRARRAQPAG